MQKERKLVLTSKEVIEDFQEKEIACPFCKSQYIIKVGYYLSDRYGVKIQRLKCNECKKNFSGVPKIMEVEVQERYKPKETIPSQEWKQYTEAQRNEKAYLLNILFELFENVKIIYNPNKKGRKFYKIQDVIYSLILKTYTKLSSRRLNSDLQLLKEKGFIEKIPDHTTLSKYLGKEELTHILEALIKISSRPIKDIDSLAIDSSGFSTSQFGRWFDFKWGQEKSCRTWIKGHISADTFTNIIVSATITRGNFADSPQLKPLLKNLEGKNIKEVCADKAYSSRENLQLITNLGAVPYIPFKSNVTGKQYGSSIWRKTFFYFKDNSEDFYKHYHKRSNVETCFHMIKQKFGKELTTKSFESQKNELLLKILCHNICCLIQEYFTRNIELHYSTQTEKIKIFVNPC
jgi:transposase/ribosomal protein L37AE/L43A